MESFVMELLENVENADLDQIKLKNNLTIHNMPKLCNSIDNIISDENDQGVIYCVWGKHEVRREILDNGIRFSFPQCPNALTLSITKNNDSDKIHLHCTTNTNIEDEDFLDSIKQFIKDWMVGIKTVCH